MKSVIFITPPPQKKKKKIFPHTLSFCSFFLIIFPIYSFNLSIYLFLCSFYLPTVPMPHRYTLYLPIKFTFIYIYIYIYIYIERERERERERSFFCLSIYFYLSFSLIIYLSFFLYPFMVNLYYF